MDAPCFFVHTDMKTVSKATIHGGRASFEQSQELYTPITLVDVEIGYKREEGGTKRSKGMYRSRGLIDNG